MSSTVRHPHEAYDGASDWCWCKGTPSFCKSVDPGPQQSINNLQNQDGSPIQNPSSHSGLELPLRSDLCIGIWVGLLESPICSTYLLEIGLKSISLAKKVKSSDIGGEKSWPCVSSTMFCELEPVSCLLEASATQKMKSWPFWRSRNIHTSTNWGIIIIGTSFILKRETLLLLCWRTLSSITSWTIGWSFGSKRSCLGKRLNCSELSWMYATMGRMISSIAKESSWSPVPWTAIATLQQRRLQSLFGQPGPSNRAWSTGCKPFCEWWGFHSHASCWDSYASCWD